MKKKILFFSVLLSSMIVTPLAGSQIIINNNSFSNIQLMKNTVAKHSSLNQENLTQVNPSNQQMNMTNINLLAKENIRPPLGVPPQPNRDIGFATVFLYLENPQDDNVKILVTTIEIRNVSDNQLQSFQFSPQEIQLKPLENSVIYIHLTNKTGYVGQEQVKAIVTYQIGKEINILESEPVEVERH